MLITGGKELEESIRRGDICALMIQEYIKMGHFTEAKQLLGELKQMLSVGSTPITYYLNKETIEALAAGLSVPISSLIPAKLTLDDEETDEFVEEAIED